MARRLLVGIVFLAALPLLATGCTSNECDGPDCGGPGVLVADMEVEWSIDGSLASTECDYFGIDHWVVTVDGPEPRQVVADCYDDPWDTGTGLYAIEEGLYNIDIAAVDIDGYDVGGASASIDLIDEGGVEIVSVVLYPEDFN